MGWGCLRARPAHGAALLFLLAIWACNTRLPPHPVALAAGPPVLEARAAEIVLVAGDASIAAFDNATDYLHDTLMEGALPAGQMHRLGARANPAAGIAPARASAILGQIGSLHPVAGGSCFIFLTSHGEEDHGFYLQDDDPLMPAPLDRALESGCGGVPTILIVSACYSGQFLTPDIERANRIIITAARADRSSFGCEAGATYTFFDECFLGALGGAADWPSVVERTRGCVGVREREIEALPSEPQVYYGSDVADLAIPAGLFGPNDAAGQDFKASGETFSAAQIPLRPADRKRLAKDLKAFAKAAAPKALTLVPNGLVVWTDRAGAATDDQAAIDTLALQRCEFLSGGACVLYAEGNRVARLLPSGLPRFHPMILARQGRLEPESVPFLKADNRALIQDYQAHQGIKALALDPNDGGIGLGYGQTLAAARDDALAQCESAGNDCVVYAEGDEVVLGWRG